MVTTFLFATAEIGVMHERTACPSTCTVQAPHSAMPQPNLVPVRPSTSRSTHSTGMSDGTSTVWSVPFTRSVITAARPAGARSPRLLAGAEPATGRRGGATIQTSVVRPLDEPVERDDRALREHGRDEPGNGRHEQRQPVGLEVAHGVHRVAQPAVRSGDGGRRPGLGLEEVPPVVA